MSTVAQRVAFGLSFLFVVTLAAVFLFLGIALVPYWQGMSGADVQDWFAGPFTRFSYLMVPIHVLSIVSLAAACAAHRGTRWMRPLLVAFAALMFCQAFNFTLYGAVLNPALQSQSLVDAEALATLDRWAAFHVVRTIGAVASVLVLLAIAIARPANTDGPVSTRGVLKGP